MPDGLVALDLGDEDERAPVTPARHGDFTLRRDAVLRASERGVGGGERREPGGAVDDVDRGGVAGEIALDAVAGPRGDPFDGRIERDERAERPVAQRVASGARREHFADERNLQELLVGARDADGDRLGLVLDRVDRARELVDPGSERAREVVGDDDRRADLAVIDLVEVERHDAGRVAEQRGDAHRGGRGEVAVVRAGAQRVEEHRRGREEIAFE